MIDLYLIQMVFPLLVAVFCMLATRKTLRVGAFLGSLIYVIITVFSISTLRTISIAVFFKSNIVSVASLFTESLLLDNFEKIIVLFGTLITMLVVGLSINKTEKGRQYYSLIFIILFLGNLACCSTDLLTFFTFSEVMVIPCFILCGVYGVDSKKVSVKFLIFHLTGSILVLLSIINIVVIVGGNDIEIMFFPERIRNYMILNNSLEVNCFIFWPLCISFLMKLSSFPFFLWNRDIIKKAEVGSILIILFAYLRVGTLGINKYLLKAFIFNVEIYKDVFLFLGLFCIIYFSLKAMFQSDIREIISNYIVGSIGFIIIGMLGVSGSFMFGTSVYWVSHVLVSSSLVLMVDVLEKRYNIFFITNDFGIITRSPVFGGIIFLICFTAIGFPLTSGFTGFYILITEVAKKSQILGVFCIFGIFLFSLYFIKLCQSIVIGSNELKESEIKVKLSFSELMFLSLILLINFTVGVYPEVLKII